MTSKPTRKGDALVLGDDDIRIERGPALKRAKATKELLDNAVTAPSLQLGGPDAFGKKIVEGEEIDYLDWGGSQNEGERVFYVHAKVPVDHTAEKLPNGDANPYFVPEHARVAADGKTRAFFTYVFYEVGTRPTEEAAIELGEKTLAGLGKFEDRKMPKSHLAHIARMQANQE